jgi:hypothetical protein
VLCYSQELWLGVVDLAKDPRDAGSKARSTTLKSSWNNAIAASKLQIQHLKIRHFPAIRREKVHFHSEKAPKLNKQL